ncbi:MAG TPA: tRNA 2-selenouridine(34) synthase MnmH [Bacillales bacterium]|nr:tRNA 2-selenouridine(34) synthase MnmH [Bacillales bacterium]
MDDFQVPETSIGQVLTEQPPIIDVRTPKEFEQFRIPGAINIPLFSNDERVRIGTTYTQDSKEAAVKLGLTFFSETARHFYDRCKSVYEKQQAPLVIHCWRGGMRSLSVVSFLNALGLPCMQLQGGIRSFRRKIVADLEQMADRLPPFIVVEGLTGTKKTVLLTELEKQGYPVLNIEPMAGHRGSTFGAIGLSQTSQKQFECMLWQRLSALQAAPYILMEAESKRIGRIQVPDFLIAAKQNGERIRLHYPFEKRVQYLMSEYEPEQHEQAIRQATKRIEKKLSEDIRTTAKAAMEGGDFRRLTALLLEHYYDPRYRYTSTQYDTPVHEVKMESLEDGLQKVKQRLGRPVFA